MLCSLIVACSSQNSQARTSRQCAQMASKKWALFFILLTVVCMIIIYVIITCVTNIFLIRNYQKQQQERQHALDIQDQLRVRTPLEHLHDHRSNPGHKILTRSERRFRERLLKKSLEKTWSQDRSRSHREEKDPVVRGHPAIKKISRMNRQPSPPKSYNWHQLHLLFNRLCIYTALPFLTFCVFCHHLRINLTESLLLEEFDEAEVFES